MLRQAANRTQGYFDLMSEYHSNRIHLFYFDFDFIEYLIQQFRNIKNVQRKIQLANIFIVVTIFFKLFPFEVKSWRRKVCYNNIL